MPTLILERWEAISPRDQGWIVGFLEGEGSFNLTKPGYASDLRYPRISASQKQREPLDRLVELLGGAVYRASDRRNRDHSGYCWTLDGPDVSSLMRVIAPLFSERRRGQIQDCVDRELRRPSRGAGNSNAKLTDAAVREIRASRLTNVALARAFGVSKHTISLVRTGKAWTHVA